MEANSFKIPFLRSLSMDVSEAEISVSLIRDTVTWAGRFVGLVYSCLVFPNGGGLQGVEDCGRPSDFRAREVFLSVDSRRGAYYSDSSWVHPSSALLERWFLLRIQLVPTVATPPTNPLQSCIAIRPSSLSLVPCHCYPPAP